ncbi:unnamed protein product [Diamesa serratosioi]
MSPAVLCFLLLCLGYSEVIGAPTSNSIEFDDMADDMIIDLSHFGVSIYGDPDESGGARLLAWTPESGKNPEELGPYSEGDILIPNVQGRNGLSSASSRWKGGVVPYEIGPSFTQQQRSQINNAIAQYHAKTCLKFIPRSSEADYIYFDNAQTGCWSSVGRVGRKQTINLQAACLTRIGTVIHEMMHAVGFLHEQNREDRDGFVSIQWQNVPENVKNNFDKASPGSTIAYNVPYDYGSVLHYSATAFSNSGSKTIVPLKSGGESMGQRDGFSGGDVNKINKMYNCGKVGGGGGPFQPAASKPGITWQRPSWERPNRPDLSGNAAANFGAAILGGIGQFIGSFADEAPVEPAANE